MASFHLFKNALSAHYKNLLATSLLLSGALAFAAPVFADGTAVGTTITNTATATYTDPVTDPTGTTAINATSNTVSVTVSEVAGITVVSAGAPVDGTTSTTGIVQGDVVYFDFIVTNTGNDPTQFFIPGAPSTVSGSATFSSSANPILVDLTGGSSFTTTVPAAGLTTSGSFPVGSTIRVRVPVTVNSSAATASLISVVLGNTGLNNNSTGTQNQPYPTAPSGNDLRTVDNATAINGETNTTAPANGEREASALSPDATVSAQLQAFAAVLKNGPTYNNNGTFNILTDDKLTYSLGLNVSNTVASGSSGYAPGDLAGTTVNGIGTNYILISDAIPAGTVFNNSVPPSAPANWTAVYSTTLTTTDATNATWSFSQPAAASITRVGFVYNAAPIASSGNGPILRGATLTGFSFVVSPTASFSGGQIANLAQVFGSTQSAPGNAVFDESGDQDPSNFTGGVADPFDSVTNKGVATPLTDGTDPGGNTGSGSDGEDNIFSISYLLNGPKNAPSAQGPTDANDDFTNQSTQVPSGTAPGSSIDPGSIPFTNTLRNPGNAVLSNLSLVPSDGTATGTVPTNTKVTITYGAQVVTYNYNGTDFVFFSGTPISTTINATTSVDYTVAVDLPAGTSLSTDTGTGFLVPIVAFVDQGTAGLDVNDSFNTTIDRVYTGYLKLLKESRILVGTGPTVQGTDGTFSTGSKSPAPGNIIEYKVTYTNIANDPTGAGIGNVILNAANTTITENGTLGSGGNNWALDNAAPAGVIDTSNVASSAADPTVGAVITFFSGAGPNPAGAATTTTSGTTLTTDVTKYVDTVGTVGPATNDTTPNGTFTFQRKLN
jgi:hypothetical protein